MPMKKRDIITQKTELEIMQALSKFSSKKVRKSRNKSRYSVFKTTKDKWLRTALSYYFVCNICDCNGTRIIEYKVVPALSTIVLFVLLPATMFYELYIFILQHSGSELYFFISAFANLLLLIINHRTKHYYIQEFEGLFDVEQ